MSRGKNQNVQTNTYLIQCVHERLRKQIVKLKHPQSCILTNTHLFLKDIIIDIITVRTRHQVLPLNTINILLKYNCTNAIMDILHQNVTRVIIPPFYKCIVCVLQTSKSLALSTSSTLDPLNGVISGALLASDKHNCLQAIDFMYNVFLK